VLVACALKHPEDGAQEGAPFIRVTERAFDDFEASGADRVKLGVIVCI